MKPYILLFSVLCFSASLFANNNDDQLQLIHNSLNFESEKVYMATDRETYTKYDDIWFSLFLVNADGNYRQKGLRNIYVELISPADTIYKRNMILCVDGLGYGDFVLDKEMAPGKYYLRAYTNYQKNFGDQFIFKKSIFINEIHSTHQEHNKAIDSILHIQNQQAIDPEIDLQFFPESGNLVNGVYDRLAFIATDQFGRGYDFEGAFFNSNDELLDSIHSLKNGVGEFRIFPEIGESYYVKIDGFEKKYPIPESKAELHFSYLGQNANALRFRLIDYEEKSTTQNYFLVNFSGGQLSSYVKIPFNEKYKQFYFPLKHCKNGINQFTLTDENLKPLKERLVFIRKDATPQIEVTLNKPDFSSRDSISVQLKHTTDSIVSTASMSVTYDDLNVKSAPYSQTIESYFLAQSELKGKIENPSYYFNEEDTTSTYKLDLLMRSHGWRKYVWDDYKNNSPQLSFEKDFGIEVSGHARRFVFNRHIVNGKATLMFLEAPFRMFDTPTDSLGRFSFKNIFFTDTSKTVVLVKNKRNKNNTEIDELKTFRPPSPITQGYGSIFPDLNKLREFNKLSYTNMMEDRIYNPDKYHILLDEISVVEKKVEEKEDDGHFRMYGSADVSIDIDEEPFHFHDVLSYLYTVPGVNVTGSGIEIRGGASFNNNDPKYMIDGIEVDYTSFIQTPIEQVDKIEVLKSPINLAVFGMTGANGVLAIYTKRGEIFYDENPITKGIIGKKIRGYYESRIFYSPTYKTKENPMPDNRITIYWNPMVSINSDSLTNIHYYNADTEGKVNIHIEGLTNDGIPFVSETKYDVNL